MKLVLAYAVLSAAFAAYAPQQIGTDPLADPRQEARVQMLGKQLRCPSCQGLSIADSPASMARSQLDKVRELVSAGRSDREVRDYFVERYGEWVLLEPKKEGFTLLVWLGPGVFLVFGLLLIFSLRRRVPPKATGKAPAPTVSSSPEGDEYLRAVRAELER